MNLLPHLADDWKQGWKWLQTQLGVAIAVAPLLYGYVDPIQDIVPHWAYQVIVGLLGVLVVLNALRKKPV